MIWLILFIALVLRLITLNQPLWLDEADNVVAAQMFDFLSFITKYSIGDYHPPGYFVLLWVWTHLFGFTEIVVRLPSVLLGIGTVLFTYLLGKQLFNKQTALVAALLLAVAPLHVYYSQEARMYSFSAFSVAALSYFLMQLINGKKGSWIGYALAAALVLYSDYVTYLIFPAHFIYLLITKQNIWKKWFSALFVSSLAFLPWLGVFPQQIAEGREAASNLPGWKKVAGGADFKNLALVWIKTLIGRISFENKIVYAGVISLLSGLSFLSIAFALKGKIKPSQKLLICWFLIPLALAWAISFFIPMLSYFRMLYILPAFYLLVAQGILNLPKKISSLMVFCLVFASLIFLSLYYTNTKFQREDWRRATSFIETGAKDQAIVLFEDNHVKFPYLYYQKEKVAAFGGLKNIQAKSEQDVVDIDQLLNGRNRIYLFEYLVEITDPARVLQKEITRLGFRQKDIYNFEGVGLVRLYERTD